MRCFFTLWAALVVIAGLALPAWSGIVVLEGDGSLSYWSGGKLKNVDEDGETESIFDFNKGTLIFTDGDERVYAKATLDEFCQTIKEMQAVMQPYMPQGTASQPEGKKTKVEVKKTSGKDVIAGYETVKYQVFSDGKLYEELWMANVPGLMAERGDLGFFKKFVTCRGNGNRPEDIEISGEYLDLMEKGWIMRSLSYPDGQPETDTDVIKIEKRDLADSEFLPPKGYRQIALKELMGLDMEEE